MTSRPFIIDGFMDDDLYLFTNHQFRNHFLNELKHFYSTILEIIPIITEAIFAENQLFREISY